MKNKKLRCKDGLMRTFIKVTNTPTMIIWKCFDCNNRIFAYKKRFAASRKAYLVELRTHVC